MDEEVVKMLDIWEVGNSLCIVGTMRKLSLEERLTNIEKCFEKGYPAQAEIFIRSLRREVAEAETDEQKLFIFNGEVKE